MLHSTVYTPISCVLVLLLWPIAARCPITANSHHVVATSMPVVQPVRTPTKGKVVKCGPLPRKMQPLADHFVQNYPKDSLRSLPATVKTEEQVVAWVSSWEKPNWWPERSRWAILECYRHKGYLFLTIKVADDLKVGDPNNLAHCVIVDMRGRTYHTIYLSRT